MFEGTYTAVVTPFTTSGAIDWSSCDRILADQLAGVANQLAHAGSVPNDPNAPVTVPAPNF